MIAGQPALPFRRPDRFVDRPLPDLEAAARLTRTQLAGACSALTRRWAEHRLATIGAEIARRRWVTVMWLARAERRRGDHALASGYLALAGEARREIAAHRKTLRSVEAG